MPRNGTGTYSLPAGNPVITLTKIRSTWANPTMSDIATALTGSMARNGEGAPTANWSMAGFRLQGTGAAINAQDYARADQVQNSSLSVTSSPANPSPNVYEGNLIFGEGTFTVGQKIIYSFPDTNTSPDVTLSINSSTPADVLRLDGMPLQPGDIRNDVPSVLMWSGTAWLLFGTSIGVIASGPTANTTAVGYQSLLSLTTGFNNSAYGAAALKLNTTGNNNTSIGAASMQENTTGAENVALGVGALASNTTGLRNIAIGFSAAVQATTANDNTVIGHQALNAVTSGSSSNTIVGASACFQLENGANNVAVGGNAMVNAVTASSNVAVGLGALSALINGNNNTACGYNTMPSQVNTSNSAALGANADVSGSNQVQLGDSATTTYAYGAVQNRSDVRDKTDITDTQLGLAFVLKLRPVDFRWNYRDGNGPRKRYHHGFIAQEVAAIGEFGGYQDHRVNGGKDVHSLGYNEFIAPIVKAIQELTAEVERLRRLVVPLEL